VGFPSDRLKYVRKPPVFDAQILSDVLFARMRSDGFDVYIGYKIVVYD
jgi:hypothetical protein